MSCVVFQLPEGTTAIGPMLAVGGVVRRVAGPVLTWARSKAKKKRALFLPSNTWVMKIGPPMLPPGFHWRTTGRFVGVKVNPRALKNSLRLKTNALPCRALVPDLVTKLITPLDVRPYSAE